MKREGASDRKVDLHVLGPLVEAEVVKSWWSETRKESAGGNSAGIPRRTTGPVTWPWKEAGFVLSAVERHGECHDLICFVTNGW